MSSPQRRPAACATLLGTPSARGLFRRAACLSGGQALLQTVSGVQAVATDMTERLGVLAPATLEAIPPETILAAQQAVTASAGTVGGQHDAEAVTTLLAGGIPLPWAPYVDGEFVTQDPVAAAAYVGRRRVDLLAGATAHEFNAAWMTADWITAAMVADGLSQAGVPAPLAARLPGPGRAAGQRGRPGRHRPGVPRPRPAARRAVLLR